MKKFLKSPYKVKVNVEIRSLLCQTRIKIYILFKLNFICLRFILCRNKIKYCFFNKLFRRVDMEYGLNKVQERVLIFL